MGFQFVLKKAFKANMTTVVSGMYLLQDQTLHPFPSAYLCITRPLVTNAVKRTSHNFLAQTLKLGGNASYATMLFRLLWRKQISSKKNPKSLIIIVKKKKEKKRCFDAKFNDSMSLR